MKRVVLITGILLSLLISLNPNVKAAQTEDNTGFASLAMPELLIGMGTRSTALGGMGAAVTNDLSALHFNPAGLCRMDSVQFEFVHNSWIQEFSRESIMFGLPLVKDGVVALGVNYIGLGTLEQTGIKPDGTIDPMGESLQLWELGGYAGFGMYLMPALSVGATLKIYMQDFSVQQNMIFAGDVGVQYQGIENVELGLAVQNLGAGVQGYNLPMLAKLGGAYKFPVVSGHTILMGTELEMPFGAFSQSIIHSGLEYQYEKLFALRVGYQLSDVNSFGGIAGLTAGMGINVGAWKVGYTFAPQGDLGTSHRISIGMDIGELAKAEAATTDKKGKKKRKKRPRFKRKMGFGMQQASSLTGAASVSSAISQEEAMMRTLLSSNLKVTTSVKRKAEGAQVIFRVKRSSGAREKKWVLNIRDKGNVLLRAFRGDELVKRIRWDGIDKNGKAVKSKLVQYTYTLTDVNGNKETAEGKIYLSGKKAAPRPISGGVVEQEFDPILFEKNRAEISPEGSEIIAQAAKMINRYPRAKIYIQGYSDAVDEADKALVLSKARAEAVARYLTAYHKVSMSRILVRGRGSKNPVASNSNPNLRGQNRRVVIMVKGKK